MLVGTISDLGVVMKLKDEVYDAGQKEWDATKENLLDISDESIENQLLMETKSLFSLPMFMCDCQVRDFLQLQHEKCKPT